MIELEYQPEHEKVFGPCECCGTMTRRVWGYLRQDGSGSAAYFVEWTPGHADHDANFDFIYGLWGEGTNSADRMALSAAFRHYQSKPSFMVIDAGNRPVAKNALVSSAATREEVLGSNLREILFALCDAVYLGDPRIPDLRVE